MAAAINAKALHCTSLSSTKSAHRMGVMVSFLGPGLQSYGLQTATSSWQQGLRMLADLTSHLATHAEEGHVAPVWVVA